MSTCVQYGKPNNATFSTIAKRLESFKIWPVSLSQSPRELAEAGFYYTGFNDTTKCYECGVTLKDWMPEEDIWEQHVKWSPNCYHVQKSKGFLFINHCLNVLQEKKVNIPCSTSQNKKNIFTGSSQDESTINVLCKICYEKKIDSVVLPCGHVVCCFKCVLKLHVCVMCRKKIKTAKKIYFS
ncbi:inhibitor of apoptosis [Neodiprion sertifer nucleopolyhedrovirus]|uniref:Inhibitor of apoptosis n=1 Tax=Neodiprion sertifer nucleopolyhedrovirus TaxID=111874 RepID=Q6JKE3_9CBAC|nr:iap [Neodiprion sertifer nucleopolyhedrovirus]AAQ96394.1 inhibitor of apoptosis [Neodiprion sertifer nucleopolyhedrovirus]